MRSVVAESLLDALALWLNDQRQSSNKLIIAFDEKVLRSSYQNNKNSPAISHGVG